MTPAFTFWFIVGLAVILGFGGLAVGTLRIVFGEKPRGADSMWFFAVLFGLLFGAIAFSDSDSPGLYTRQVGAPLTATVSGLTFLNGMFGGTDRVRVDTDQGVYLLPADALVPARGTIVIVRRAKTWNHDERLFVCLAEASSSCWATLRSDS